MPLLKKEFHQQVYLFGILLLAISIPLSRFLMSLSQLILFGNWLLEGDLKRKMKTFFSDRAALVLTSIFLLHLLGLFFTTDFNYAFKDLRTKVPIALLPLIFSTSMVLDRKKWHGILLVYLLAVTVGTLVGTGIYVSQQHVDNRGLSPFISHIRFSLNLCMAIAILLFFLMSYSREFEAWKSALLVLLLAWFMVYLYISQSFTSYYILFILVLAWLAALIFRMRNRVMKTVLLLLIIAIPVMAYLYIHREYQRYFTPKEEAPTVNLTSLGNYYTHDTASAEIIGGYHLLWYVCHKEMKQVWNSRSALDYNDKGSTGLVISDVLLRYLTSKGLHKDAQSVASLTDQEMKYIENGIADVEETRGSPLHQRLRKIFWEYQTYRITGNSSGHSVMMRLEYWKASVHLIKDHYLTGVGTGDMNQAFENYYEQIHSKLTPEWRRRSHNQFLSITVGFGVLGLLWFIFALFYPPLLRKKFSHFLFSSFFIILMFSMLPEDTLESQDGVTFAAFFFSLLMWGKDEKNP